ncbi:hypothetical protein [Nevskia sp.]|uniref:hypothetical protein n=1 Tax=Nevskia sp. TaxID=1929292 RepID=UPI003F6FF78C
MKAAVGRIVIIKGVPSNGTDEHPALITRVWGTNDPVDSPVMVNLTVFPDCLPPVTRGSVMLFNTREQAVADYEKRRAALLANGGSPGVETYPAAFWPDRV